VIDRNRVVIVSGIPAGPGGTGRLVGHLATSAKEKGFKSIDNESWVRDFELEVKNVGDKPIYHLLFQLEVPEAQPGGLGFALSYGRRELSKSDAQIVPEDVPIKPGETVFLKIKEVVGWEKAVRAGHFQNRIHRVKLEFLWLALGDGTGFNGTGGAPWPGRRRCLARQRECRSSSRQGT